MKYMMKFMLFGGLFFISAATCGCLTVKQPAQKVDYYSLEYAPPEVNVNKQLPATLRIDMFSVAPEYDTRKIVYQEGPFKKNAYVYHRWWAKPNEMTTSFFARDLEAASLFEAVFAFDRTMPATHSLRGSVDVFHEDDTPDVWYAVIQVSVSLINEKAMKAQNAVLLQKKYSAREPCREKTPLALAEAMSKAVSTVSVNMLLDIYGALSRFYRESK